ncbi:MAG: hypothetical protein PVH61_13855 [Candidatus Aminicenantes bacterium]|jgi:hypothetical protein
MDKLKYKIGLKTGSKVKRIATTGLVLDFRKWPVVVEPEVLKNPVIKNAVDVLEKVHDKPAEKKENPASTPAKARKKGGK